MLHLLYEGAPVYVVGLNPGGKYCGLADGIQGQVIQIAGDSFDCINPLDFSFAGEGEYASFYDCRMNIELCNG